MTEFVIFQAQHCSIDVRFDPIAYLSIGGNTNIVERSEAHEFLSFDAVGGRFQKNVLERFWRRCTPSTRYSQIVFRPPVSTMVPGNVWPLNDFKLKRR